MLLAGGIACSGDPEGTSTGGGGGAGAASGTGTATGTGTVTGTGTGTGTGGGPAAGWAARAPLPGGPRQETAVVALDGRVHVLGGFDEAGSSLDEVEIYDPATDTWSAGVPLPEPLHHIHAAVVDGRIYALGALRQISFQAVGRAYVFDPATSAWTQLTSMPAGTERGGGAVGVIGGKVYIAGGLRAGNAVADFSAYDVASDTWEALPPLPSPRDHLVGGAVDGVFYAIGGRAGSISSITGAVDAFDPQAGMWSSRAPMLTPRGGAAAGIIAGRFVVVGGEGNAGAASGVFPEVEVYDPAADAWSSLGEMPTPRHGMGAAAVGSTLYVPGGADQQAFSAVDTHEAFTMPATGQAMRAMRR